MSSRMQRYLSLDPPSNGIVRVNRTSEPFESELVLRSVFLELNRKLDPLRNRGYALLVDTRDAIPRNDTEFERAFAPLRARIFVGFEPRAVLMRSTAGQLQARRHAREDRVEIQVFVSEADALAHLASRRGPAATKE